MQTRKTWEVFAPGKSTGAGACCWFGFLIGPIGLLAQWGERVGRKIKWKGEKSPESLQINLDRKQVIGLNWMYRGPFENDTYQFFILGDIWREGEGSCFWRMFFHIPGIYNSRWWGREFFFPSSGDWFHFSSVAQSCATLCDPMNRSMPGLPVHH